MRRIKRFGWTTKAALLVMLLTLLATSMVLFVPREAYAFCCGHRITERYYSDASFTTQVGQCIEDECAGTYTCTGEQTQFLTATSICCDHCLV